MTFNGSIFHLRHLGSLKYLKILQILLYISLGINACVYLFYFIGLNS